MRLQDHPLLNSGLISNMNPAQSITFQQMGKFLLNFSPSLNCQNFPRLPSVRQRFDELDVVAFRSSYSSLYSTFLLEI